MSTLKSVRKSSAKLNLISETPTWKKFSIHPEILRVIEKNRFVREALQLIQDKCGEVEVYHALGVANNVVLMAEVMGLPFWEKDVLIHAALTHDVGKAFLEKNFSRKPCKLSSDEEALMQKHPRQSFGFLVKREESLSARIVVSHHEHTKGYPRRRLDRRNEKRVRKWLLLRDRRSGCDRREDDSWICEMSRFLAIADIFHSMAYGCDNSRPYIMCKDPLDVISEKIGELNCFSQNKEIIAIRHLRMGDFRLLIARAEKKKNTLKNISSYPHLHLVKP